MIYIIDTNITGTGGLNHTLFIGYAVPDSTIHILKNVLLNNKYEHTIYFTDRPTQKAYFESKKKYTIEKHNYQRVDKGVLKVGLPYEYLIDCNYLMFTNLAHIYSGNQVIDVHVNEQSGTKTYYAFINNIEYINNNVTAIYYEIDVMQTWLLGADYALQESFVEREHTDNDAIGVNTIEEGLPIGEYEFEPVTQTSSGSLVNKRNKVENGQIRALDSEIEQYSVVIASTVQRSEQPIQPFTEAQGDMYGGFYSGVAYFVANDLDFSGTLLANKTTAEVVNKFLENLTTSNMSDAILSIYEVPHFIAPTHVDGGTIGTVDKDACYNELSISFPKNTAWDVYPNASTPAKKKAKNNKLYTYPYSLLYVTDNMGNSAEYRYEFFSSQTNCEFELQGLTTVNPEIQLIPENYNLTGNTTNPSAGSPQRLNFNEKMAISTFPQCAYNIDSFKAWLAQHSRVLIGQAVNTGIGVAKSLAAPALKGAELTKLDKFNAGTDVLSQAVSSIAQIAQASLLPPQAHGQQTQALPIANGSFGFFLYHVHPRSEYALIIDDFFSKFGYACKRIKIPNVNVRDEWCYTKTIGCNLTNAYMPQDVATTIKTIFDKGITFWKHGDQIGNYNLDNPITVVNNNSNNNT